MSKFTTYRTKAKDISKKKHIIDAEGKVLGRVATQIAVLLMGKDKPKFSRYMNMGDMVEVYNASKLKFTGRKLEKKMYYSHSGYPGGFKEQTLQELLEKNPAEVLRRAVWGMLPKNKLRKKMISNLKIYVGDKEKKVS